MIYASLMLILFWVLVGWCKWRYWEYLRDRGYDSGHDRPR